MLKKLFTLAVLAAVGAGVLGCEASAHVGEPEDHDHRVVEKRTTVERDGDRTVHEEVHESE